MFNDYYYIFFFKPGLQWDVLLNESVKSFLSQTLSVSTELVLFLCLKKLATVKSGCAVRSWPFAILSRHFQMQWPNLFSCLGKRWFCCGRHRSRHFFSAVFAFFSLQTTCVVLRPPTPFYASWETLCKI